MRGKLARSSAAGTRAASPMTNQERRIRAGLLLPWIVGLCAYPGLVACNDGAAGPSGSEADSPEPVSSTVRFVDGTAAAGIDFVHESGKSEEFFSVEYMTGGAIFFDAEGDGDQDLYMMNGTRLVGPPQDPPPVDPFYRNDGTGRFRDETAGSGLGDPRYSEAVSGADIDNDGDIDLHVTNFDEANALYRNDGTGRFEDVAAEAGVEGGPCMDSASAFADVDRDGWLDLYVGYYFNHSMEYNRKCAPPGRNGKPIRRYCSVEAYDPLPDMLYRNKGDGTFEDVSESSGIASALGRTMGVAFADYDDDGDPDIFVSCDRSANLYFENVDGRTFREIGLQTGAALAAGGKAQAGMGIAAADFDGDARLDVGITYFEEEWNGFYTNLGNHQLRDMAERNGTARPSYNLLAWGIEFLDADLDADLDCYVANGHIMDNVHLFREPIAPYAQPNLFYLNQGDGMFASLGKAAGPGLEIEKVSRGLAAADVDNDGDVDLLVVNLHDRPDLLINESARESRHWLTVRTVGTKSNRDGIGARVIVHLADRQLVREIHTGQSYFSQSDLRAHFGLGELAVVPRLEVRWPSGARTELVDVAADRILEVVEP
jgi:hypothetical protein